jgi:hypothetical protein
MNTVDPQSRLYLTLIWWTRATQWPCSTRNNFGCPLHLLDRPGPPCRPHIVLLNAAHDIVGVFLRHHGYVKDLESRFVLDSSTGRDLVVALPNNRAAPAWSKLQMGDLQHVGKLVTALVQSDVGKAVQLSKEDAMAWFQDVAFASDIFRHGLRFCTRTLVSLHQSFPEAVSVPRVVASLAGLMTRVVGLMHGELPAPYDPKRSQIFDTAQLLLEFEEVCSAEEVSKGMLTALEHRMVALQEVGGVGVGGLCPSIELCVIAGVLSRCW